MSPMANICKRDILMEHVMENRDSSPGGKKTSQPEEKREHPEHPEHPDVPPGPPANRPPKPPRPPKDREVG